MEDTSVIIDPIHIFNYNYYVKKDLTKKHLIHVVQFQDSEELYFLIKKEEKLNFNLKYSYINIIEKSYELIHPSITNIAGFSTNKLNIYYKYIQNAQDISSIELTDHNIQKMFLGVASGLSYLLSKGYYFSNFSINSIIFDDHSNPKLIDYIDRNDISSNPEKDLILKYVDLIKTICSKKMETDKTLSLKKELKTLIERCQNNTNFPTLNDFIDFFESSAYRTNSEIDITKYVKFLKLGDKVIFDLIDSIENDLYLGSKKIKILALNKLPEYYIKHLFRFVPTLYNKIIRFVYNENLSLIMEDWRKLSFSKPFEIYEKLMNEMRNLENQNNQKIYFSNERKEIEYKIDSIRIQAIYYLKKASLESNNAKIKIELAMQYIKGSILPINLNKALNVLKSIQNEDSQIKNMKNKLKSAIHSSSFEYLIQKVPSDQREKLIKAEKGDIFSLLFIGFAFYTGFNGFPISRPMSIQCYRKASKMSADAMAFLGYLYLNGIFFPQNLKRARNCFKRATDKGSTKAEIIDSIIRKHMWRSYLLEFNINDIFNTFLLSYKSIIINDLLAFPFMNYYIENGDGVYLLELHQDDTDLQSDKTDNNCSTYLDFSINDTKEEKREKFFSEKILLSSENYEGTNDVEKLMFLAKSYFYGENGFPVNYTKALRFFKLAADKGNSEAQWRYASMLNRSISITDDPNEDKKYFEKSIKQNDPKGKLYYALQIKKTGGDILLFEKLIKESYESGNLDAMHFFAMYLETIDTSLERSIVLYKKAAEKGHFDSFIRLTNIYKIKMQTELYKNCLELSTGILNEPFLVELIRLFDNDQNYVQSNILIRLGITINYQLFNFYYIDHLLYGKGMSVNIERAKKLAILAFKDEYPVKYQDQYIYSMLQALVLNNEHKKSVSFLLKHRKRLDNKYSRYYRLFYKKLNKKLAKKIYITSCFCCQEYVACHDELMMSYFGKESFLKLQTSLLCLAKKDKNPYALAIIGKLIKGLPYTRDLKLAIMYFVSSAEKECPLGYYYIGKEFFYGRCLDRDYDKAKTYLLKAIKDDAEPRAGYYLFKIPGIRNDENIDDVELLKTGVEYGHKKAFYKYGRLLYTGEDERIPKDVEKGLNLLQQSIDLKYKKAILFCKFHGIDFKEADSSEDEDYSFIETEYSESTKYRALKHLLSRDGNQDSYSQKNNECESIESDEIEIVSIVSHNDKKERNNSELSDSDNDISILNGFWQ